MKFISAQKIKKIIKLKSFISEIENIYKNESNVPLRQVYNISTENNLDQMMLMPAFSKAEYYGVKVLNVYENNPAKGLSRVNALYILYENKHGSIKAVFDGTEITKQRTAIMSGIASKFLSKNDSKKLLVCGTGALVPYMINAHCFVRPIKEVFIWGRNFNKVNKIVNSYKNSKLKIKAVNCLEKACGLADIITSVTSAKKEFIKGKWLNENVHIDLVGAHTEHMAELDPYGYSCGDIYVDDKQAVLSEAGDLIKSLKLGLINKEDIKLDIKQLIIDNKMKRSNSNKITIYKSVGHALSDLATAIYLFNRL